MEEEKVIMHIKVMSRRLFRISQSEGLVPLLKDLRTSAEKADGFISRATYSKLDDPGEVLVISEWKSVDSWSEWMHDASVRKIQWKIDSLIGEKTIFDVYKPEDY